MTAKELDWAQKIGGGDKWGFFCEANDNWDCPAKFIYGDGFQALWQQKISGKPTEIHP